MTVEVSVTDARAKRRVLVMLQGLGHRVSSGAVRMAHPFSIEIRDVSGSDLVTLRQLLIAADPGAVMLDQVAPRPAA